MAEVDRDAPRPTLSRVDLAWLALPYVLAIACAVPTWLAGDLSRNATWWSIGLCAAFLAWHTGWVVWHPDWLARRLSMMLVYYVGLVALTAGLFFLSFNFFPLYLVCYPMAFVALPCGWSYAGVVLTTVVAVGGPGLLTLTPQNVIVTAAAATLAAAAGGSIRAWETAAERHRATNAELTRIRGDLEAALAENVRLTGQLVAEAREAGVASERTRLAAEIHDTLAAGLSGILAQLEALDAQLPDDVAARSRVGITIEVARECLVEARQSVAALRAGESGTDDLCEAIRVIAERIGRRFDLPVGVEVVGPVTPLPDLVADAVLRAAREALTNAAKHAEAEHAYVTVSYLDDLVAVDIADDGHGRFPRGEDDGQADGCDGSPREVSGQAGHGLVIMAERLAAVGGRVEVSATPGRGTTVTLTVPVDLTEGGR